MKYFLLCLVVTFVITCEGMRAGSRNADIDDRRIMYALPGSEFCDICVQVVGDIQALLKGLELVLQNLLDSLCADLLPQQFIHYCTSIVDEFLPILFDLINDMSPQDVCALLTLCASEAAEIPEFTGSRGRSPAAVLNYALRTASGASRVRALKDRRINYLRNLAGENHLCEACGDAIGYIHEAVACNYTWGMVAEVFGPLCEIYPLRDACYQFFNNLPSDVNDFADKYLDPIEDCEIFGFCREEIIEEEEEAVIEEDVPMETEEEEEPVEVVVEDVLIPVEPRRHANMKRSSRVLRRFPYIGYA